MCFFSLVDFGYWLLFFVCSSFSHSRWVRIERQNWVDLLLLLILLLQILADSCVQTDVAKLLSKRHNCMCINEKVFYGLLFWSIVLFRCLIRSVFESAWTNNKLAKKRLSAKWKKIDNNINIFTSNIQSSLSLSLSTRIHKHRHSPNGKRTDREKNRITHKSFYGLFDTYVSIIHASETRASSWFNKPLHSITIPLQFEFEFVYE